MADNSFFKIDPAEQRSRDEFALELVRNEQSLAPNDLNLQKDIAFREAKLGVQPRRIPTADELLELNSWQAPAQTQRSTRQPTEEELEELEAPASFFTETIPSLPARARASAEASYSGAKLGWSEPKLAMVTDTIQQMFNMSPEAYVQTHPDHWLAQQYMDLVGTVEQEKLTASSIQGELNRVRPFNEGLAGRIVGGAAESLLPITAGLAVGAITKSPVLAGSIAMGGGSGQQFGSSYLDAREHLSPQDAMEFAARAGFYEGSFEMLPFTWAAKGATPLLKWMRFAAAEAPQEFLTQFAQGTDEKLTYRPDKTWMDILGESLEAGASGALIGGLFGPAASRLHNGGQKVDPKYEGFKDEFVKNWEQLQSAKELIALGQPVDITAVDQVVKQKFGDIESRFLAQVTQDELATTKKLTELGAGQRAAETGLDSEKQLALLQTVADKITAPELPETVERIQGINENSEAINAQKIAETAAEEQAAKDEGRMPRPQETLTRYVNPNDATPTDQLVITSSSLGVEEIGMNAKQVSLQGGTRLLGIPSVQMSEELGNAIVDATEKFRKALMPDANIFIVNQTLAEAHGVAGHRMLSSGVHLIYPRNMTLAEGKFGKGVAFNEIRYNPQTAFETVSSLDHEHGHALLTYMREALKTDPQYSGRYAQLVTQHAALMTRINARQMPSDEFGNTWLGPWKLARGLLPTQKSKNEQHAKAWELTGVDRARMKSNYWLQERVVSINGKPVKFAAVDPKAPIQVALKRQYDMVFYGRTPPISFEQFLEKYFSFDEYFAEQMARYQFHREAYKKTGLGDLFEAVLGKLRQLFKTAKASKRIAPSKQFAEFVDELTAAGGIRLDANPKLVEPIPQPTAEEISNALEEQQQIVSENPQRSTAVEKGLDPGSPEWAKQKRELLEDLTQLGLPRGSEAGKAIRAFIKAGEFQAAAQKIIDVRAGIDVDLDLRDSPPTPDIASVDITDWQEVQQFSDGTTIDELGGRTARRGFVDPDGNEWFFKGSLNVRLNSQGKDLLYNEILNSRMVEMLGIATTYTAPAFKDGELVGLASMWQPGLRGYIDHLGNWTQDIDLEYQVRLALAVGLGDFTDYHDGNIMLNPRGELVFIDLEGGPAVDLNGFRHNDSGQFEVYALWKWLFSTGSIKTTGPLGTLAPYRDVMRDKAKVIFSELNLEFMEHLARSLPFNDRGFVDDYMQGVRSRMQMIATTLGFAPVKGTELLFDPERLLGIQLMSRAGLSEAEVSDPAKQAVADVMYKKLGTKSPFVLRWFGDWTKDKQLTELPINTYYLGGGARQTGNTILLPELHSVVSHVNTHEPVLMYRGDDQMATKGYTVLSPRAGVFFDDRIVDQKQFHKLQADYIAYDLRKSEVIAKIDSLEQGEPYFLQRAKDELFQIEWRMQQLSSRLEQEMSFIEGAQNRALVPVYASIHNPLVVEIESDVTPDAYILSQLAQLGMTAGHDGVMIKGATLRDGTHENIFMAFQPWQVKYAQENKGTFSDSPRMDLDLTDPGDEAIARTDAKARKFFGDKHLGRALNYTSKGWKYQFLQTQQIAHLHPESEAFQQFSRSVSHYQLDKLRIMSRGEQVLEAWNQLSFDSTNRVEAALRAEYEKKVHWTEIREVPSQTGLPTYVHEFKSDGSTYTELKTHGIDVTTELGQREAALYLKTKNALLFNLDQMTRAFLTRQLDRMQNSPSTFRQGEAVAFLQRVAQIRNKPFLPQQRFGRFVWEVQRKNERGNWQPIHREAFESEPEWVARGAELKTRVKGSDERVVPVRLATQAAVLMQLPFDFAELAANELGLTPDEVKTLVSVMQPLKQDKFFRSFEDRYLAITGASPDFPRSLASFFWHNSNQIAKLDYKGKFNQALRNLRAEVRELGEQAVQSPEATLAYADRSNMLRYAEHQAEYTMHPADEFYRARSALSIAFLFGNVKTALLNLYGLITTYSDLTSNMGFLTGNKVFAGAVYDNIKGVMGRHTYTDAESAALDRATREGLLDQAYAYYLAAQATAGTFSRQFTKRKFGRHIIKGKRAAVSLGMWPFRATEIAARRITFLAKFRQSLALEQARVVPEDVILPPAEERAYSEAARATNLLQNDYTTGNRIPLMQGKVKSLVTLFMSFMQHMMFHSWGGYEKGIARRAALEGTKPRAWFAGYTMKIWLITLLLAGLEGLPGFENILDLLDMVWKKFTGKPLRLTMRQAYHDVTGRDPAEAMYGLGHNAFGFNISRSLGFGRVIPATDALSSSGRMPSDVMNLTLGVAGIAGSFVKYGLNLMYQTDKPLSSLERYTTGMPGGFGNFLRGLQWSMHGARSRNGALLTRDLETEELRELTGWEIGGAMLGFQPTSVSQEREMRFEVKEAIQYWQAKRQILLDQLWFAHWSENGDLRNDVNEAIGEFNREIPYAQMRITGETRRQSLKARMRRKALEERGIPEQKIYRPLARELREAY